MNDTLVESCETDERLRRGIGEYLDRVAGEVLSLVDGHVDLVLHGRGVHVKVVRVGDELAVVAHVVGHDVSRRRHLASQPDVERLLLVLHVQHVAEHDSRRRHDVIVHVVDRLTHLVN